MKPICHDKDCVVRLFSLKYALLWNSDLEISNNKHSIFSIPHDDLTPLGIRLNVGHTIHISSIQLPEGCTPTITDRDFTVATIAAPRGGLGDSEEEDSTEEETEDKEENKSDS